MKFSILEWEYIEDAGFLIKYSVASNQHDRLDFYQTVVPYKGEDPQLFIMTARNYMVAHVAKMDNLKAAKRLLSGYSFTEPLVHFYEEIGDRHVS
jgi:hypothetical protein